MRIRSDFKPFRLSRHTLTAVMLLLLVGAICLVSGLEFLKMHRPDVFYPSQGVTHVAMLSDYFGRLKNSPGDSEIYVFKGEAPGGRILILGGTHPNEPAGFVTSVLLLENIRVLRGTVFILPQANLSGFTHNDPQEGNPQHFGLETGKGIRWFRFGSRLTNPVHQWPDPVLHINPAGQKLAGMESRNLNRSYPGRPKGSLTEKIAYAITKFIREEKIDLSIDLHEAAPEYPVINAIVFHENSAELAATALMELQMDGYEFRLEASPPTLRGLSHREWGDHTGTMAVLLESANAAHGRLKGRPSPELIIHGKDRNYVKASRLGLLFVPFTTEGIPLRKRVSRHLAAIQALAAGLSELYPEKSLIFQDFPQAATIEDRGIGPSLHPPK